MTRKNRQIVAIYTTSFPWRRKSVRVNAASRFTLDLCGRRNSMTGTSYLNQSQRLYTVRCCRTLMKIETRVGSSLFEKIFLEFSNHHRQIQVGRRACAPTQFVPLFARIFLLKYFVHLVSLGYISNYMLDAAWKSVKCWIRDKWL